MPALFLAFPVSPALSFIFSVPIFSTITVPGSGSGINKKGASFLKTQATRTHGNDVRRSIKVLAGISLLLILFILPGCNILMVGGGLAAGWYAVPVLNKIKAARTGVKPDDGSAHISPFTPCRPFKPYGTIDRNFEYEDFRRKGGGYTFTLVNRSPAPLYNFNVFVYGLDVYDRVIYARDFHVPAIEGKAKFSRFLTGYNLGIYRVRAEVYQNPGFHQLSSPSASR